MESGASYHEHVTVELEIYALYVATLYVTGARLHEDVSLWHVVPSCCFFLPVLTLLQLPAGQEELQEAGVPGRRHASTVRLCHLPPS